MSFLSLRYLKTAQQKLSGSLAAILVSATQITLFDLKNKPKEIQLRLMGYYPLYL